MGIYKSRNPIFGGEEEREIQILDLSSNGIGALFEKREEDQKTEAISIEALFSFRQTRPREERHKFICRM